MTEALELKVTASGDQAVGEFTRVGTAARTGLGQAETAATGLKASLASIGSVALGVGLIQGVEELARTLDSAAHAASNDVASQTILATTLRNSADATSDQIDSTEKFIESQSKLAAVVQSEVRPAFDVLVRSTHDIGQAQTLLRTALDVSAGTGRDVTSVATALSKAYEGDTVALKRLLPEVGGLIRDGASFSEILQTLTTDFHGLAQESAANNPAQRLSVDLEELKITIGRGVLPVIDDLDKGLTKLEDVFGALPAPAQAALANFAALGTASVVLVGGVAVAANAIGRVRGLLSSSEETGLADELTATAAAATASATAVETAASSAAVAAGAATSATGAITAETASQLALFNAAGEATFALEGQTTQQLALFSETEVATGGLVAESAAMSGLAASSAGATAASENLGGSSTRLGGSFLAGAAGVAAAGLIIGTTIKSIYDSGEEQLTKFGASLTNFSDAGLVEVGRKFSAIGEESKIFDGLLRTNIASAQRYVDANVAAGRSMGDFQEKIDKAKEGQKLMNADMAAAAAITGNQTTAVTALGNAYSTAASQAATMAAAVKNAASAVGGAFSLGNAKLAFSDALTALDEGTKASGGAAKSELDMERAARGVESAQRDLTSAEENLARVRAGATADEKARVQVAEQFAELNTQDAQQSESDAFNALQTARRRGSVKEQNDAERAYERAVLNTKDAIFRQADAQAAQNSVNDRGKDGNKELADAIQEVTDKQFALREAIAATQQQSSGSDPTTKSAKEQRDLFEQAATNAGTILQELIDQGVPADVVAGYATVLEGQLEGAAAKAGIAREEFEKTKNALAVIVALGRVIPDALGGAQPPVGPQLGASIPAPGTSSSPSLLPQGPVGPPAQPPAPGPTGPQAPTRDIGGPGSAGESYKIGVDEFFKPNTGGTFVPLHGASVDASQTTVNNYFASAPLAQVSDSKAAEIPAKPVVVPPPEVTFAPIVTAPKVDVAITNSVPAVTPVAPPSTQAPVVAQAPLIPPAPHVVVIPAPTTPVKEPAAPTASPSVPAQPNSPTPVFAPLVEAPKVHVNVAPSPPANVHIPPAPVTPLPPTEAPRLETPTFIVPAPPPARATTPIAPNSPDVNVTVAPLVPPSQPHITVNAPPPAPVHVAAPELPFDPRPSSPAQIRLPAPPPVKFPAIPTPLPTPPANVGGNSTTVVNNNTFELHSVIADQAEVSRWLAGALAQAMRDGYISNAGNN